MFGRWDYPSEKGCSKESLKNIMLSLLCCTAGGLPMRIFKKGIKTAVDKVRTNLNCEVPVCNFWEFKCAMKSLFNFL